MKTFEQLWEEIEDSFEFEKVKKVMDFLEWRWATYNDVPTTAQIIRHAKRMCKEAYGRKTRYGSGGFYAEYNDGCLTLYFAVDLSETW